MEIAKHCMWEEISGVLVDLGWKVLKFPFGDLKLKKDLPRIGCRGQTEVFCSNKDNPKQ